MSWVQALVAAGYEVFAINPFSVGNYCTRHSTSGAKSDAADAHLLAEIVRLDRAHHRTVAVDSDRAEAIKLAARTHQTMIWERSRHVLQWNDNLTTSCAPDVQFTHEGWMVSAHPAVYRETRSTFGEATVTSASTASGEEPNAPPASDDPDRA